MFSIMFSLAKTLTVSGAGTPMVNGLYKLDTSNESIRFIRSTQHPVTNENIIIEISKTKILSLHATHSFFVIQSQNVHYYALKSPLYSLSPKWECIAGVNPLPKITISDSDCNVMKAITTTKPKLQSTIHEIDNYHSAVVSPRSSKSVIMGQVKANDLSKSRICPICYYHCIEMKVNMTIVFAPNSMKDHHQSAHPQYPLSDEEMNIFYLKIDDDGKICNYDLNTIMLFIQSKKVKKKCVNDDAEPIIAEIVTNTIDNLNDLSDEISKIKATKCTFFENTYLFEHYGIVLYQGRDSKYGDFLILDDTIFHPQGGGQPADNGIIFSMDGKIEFKVNFVSNHSMNDKIVCHYGEYTQKSNDIFFKIGDAVKQSIDKNEREMNARLHSGGHLIDIGMNAIGKKLGINFVPIKEFHFAKGAYVEYNGDIPLEQSGDFMKKLLQKEMDCIIDDNASVKVQIKMMQCDEYLDKVAKIGNDEKEREEHMKKMRICKDSMVRVLSFPGFENGECMCDGTHIDRIGRIKKLSVTKFEKKNKNFRVSYKVE